MKLTRGSSSSHQPVGRPPNQNALEPARRLSSEGPSQSKPIHLSTSLHTPHYFSLETTTVGRLRGRTMAEIRYCLLRHMCLFRLRFPYSEAWRMVADGGKWELDGRRSKWELEGVVVVGLQLEWRFLFRLLIFVLSVRKQKFERAEELICSRTFWKLNWNKISSETFVSDYLWFWSN